MAAGRMRGRKRRLTLSLNRRSIVDDALARFGPTLAARRGHMEGTERMKSERIELPRKYITRKRVTAKETVTMLKMA